MNTLNTRYEEIVDVSKIGMNVTSDINRIMSLAERENLNPSKQDKRQTLLLCIDFQYSFMEDWELGVKGSKEDVARTTRFIHNNMNGLSRIMCTMDTHRPHQIFFPGWWENSNGEHPGTFENIKYQDVKDGKWRPIRYPLESLEYLEGLVKNSKQELTIWPYHCIEGTTGCMLESQLSQMINFHSAVKKCYNPIVPKGNDPLSEMYGVIRPEFSKKNFVNMPVLNFIEKFDEIYIVGEASSHCVLESVKQIGEYFVNRPEITQKITVLEDCTSPITGCEQETKDAFENLKRKYGMKFAKSTDIQL